MIAKNTLSANPNIQPPTGGNKLCYILSNTFSIKPSMEFL